MSIRLTDGGDPLWGPFIYDGNESENIKRFQEHVSALAPHQGDICGELIAHTAISGNPAVVVTKGHGPTPESR